MKLSNLETFCLILADSNLILGHRLSEWCGHGPELEQDIALINVSLDLIGQSRSLYQHIAKNGETEDDIAYLRDAKDFKNHLLCEIPNGHFGDTIIRQFLYDSFHYFLLEGLTKCKNNFLRGYALKSIKEVQYHLKHSGNWSIRLGDGTNESHNKLQESLNNIWAYTPEMFELNTPEIQFYEKLGLNKDKIKNNWINHTNNVLREATLKIPESNWGQSGGKTGQHTEHLGFILAEMQHVRRSYPDAKNW